MKDETSGVAIDVFVGLKPKMYLLLVYDNSKHKKAKGVNKIVATNISHNEFKDVLSNKKYLRHSVNRIQGENHRIGTYEINKFSLFCFDDKIYIQSNGYETYEINKISFSCFDDKMCIQNDECDGLTGGC